MESPTCSEYMHRSHEQAQNPTIHKPCATRTDMDRYATRSNSAHQYGDRHWPEAHRAATEVREKGPASYDAAEPGPTGARLTKPRARSIARNAKTSDAETESAVKYSKLKLNEGERQAFEMKNLKHSTKA